MRIIDKCHSVVGKHCNLGKKIQNDPMFIMGTKPSMVAPAVFFLIIDKFLSFTRRINFSHLLYDSYNEYMMATRRWVKK
jgi:hypothetical protein